MVELQEALEEGGDHRLEAPVEHRLKQVVAAVVVVDMFLEVAYSEDLEEMAEF